MPEPNKIWRIKYVRTKGRSIGNTVSAFIAYAPELNRDKSHQWTAVTAWTLSYAWIMLKDAGWLGVIVLVGFATYVVSSITMRIGRTQ
jgi:hypothetical protein